MPRATPGGDSPEATAATDAAALLPPLTWPELLPAFDESPAQVVILAGPELRLAYQNRASVAVVGRRPLGMPAADAFPEYLDWLLALDRVVRERRPVTFEHAPMQGTGEGGTRAMLLDAVVTPLFDAGGRVVAVHSQAVDVTPMLPDDQRVRQALAVDQVSTELTRSLDVEQVCQAVTRSAARVFTGWCMLDVWEDDGTLRRASIAHHEPARHGDVQRMLSLPRVSGRAVGERESLTLQVARQGEVRMGGFAPGTLVAAATSEEHAAIFERLRPAWYLVVPVQVGPRRLGALSVLRSEGEPAFNPFDRHAAEQFAERAAVALAHARDYDEQRRAVLLLQRNLLPVPPAPPGETELAVRYRAGGTGSEVGGDWYDLVPLGGGRLAMAVGDVQGHDLTAATLMSQLRGIVRAFALSGLPPGRIAERANGFLSSLDTERLVTLSYLEVHPREHLVMWSRAGHVPALAVAPDGAVQLLQGSGGLPLGVDPEGRWPEETTHVAPGSVLAVFTDGLVEAPGRSYEEGIDRLAAVLRERIGDDLEAVADELLRSLLPGSAADDVALVLLRLPQLPQGAGRRVVRPLPPASWSTPIARQFLGDLLAAWRVGGDTAQTALLLVSELVANAARQTDEKVELRVELAGDLLRVGVFDDSHRQPRLVAPGPDEPSGRGLQLVDMLSASWGVDPEDNGKCVWFTLTVEPAADRVPAGS